MENKYKDSILKQFRLYKILGEKAFTQVPEEMLTWQYNEESNSVAILVKHLSGNMLSRWTDFLTTDGEKEWRDRDSEFRNSINSGTDLFEKWEQGWHCLFDAIDSLKQEDLSRKIYIHSQAHTVSEALNRQLAHNAYHIGQIAYLAKMITGRKWNNLPRSIDILSGE